MILTALLLAVGVKIVLPAEARVRGTELSVAQVAKVKCDDAALAERVSKLSLGYSPAPGYSRLFTADQLRNELARQLGDVQFDLSGASACRVFPEIERVRGDAIEAAARAELTSKLTGMDAQASLSEPVTGVDVPAGLQGATLVASVAPEAVRPGLVAVGVKVQIDGSTYRTLWTNWKVEMWELRPVLKRQVHTGETLTSELFEQKRVAVGALFGQKRLGERQLFGAVAAHDLAAGAVVLEPDVLRPNLVQKGDSLFLTIKKGAVSARVAAVAQESGALGDRVRVQLASDKTRVLIAVIASRGSAEINLAPEQP